MNRLPLLMVAGALAATLGVDAVAQTSYTDRRRDRLSWRNLPPSGATVVSPTVTSPTASAPCTSATTAPTYSAPAPAPTTTSYAAPTYSSTDSSIRRSRLSRTRTASPTYAPPPTTSTTAASSSAVPCDTTAASTSGSTSGAAVSGSTVVAAPVLLAAAPGASAVGLLPSAQVPEPSALALFGLGAAGLWIARRRRR